MVHYEIELFDEVCPRTFDNKCNVVNVDNSHYIICYHSDGDVEKEVLAIIPHHRVKYIGRVEEK